MRRIHLTVAALGFVATLGAAACGSDENNTAATSGAATESTVAPEEVIVSDETVQAGLTTLPGTIAIAIAAIGTPEAKEKLAAIEAEWFSFEGTIREKDTTLYLAIEDQLTPLQRQIEVGDSATALITAATLSGLFVDYIAKYPVG